MAFMRTLFILGAAATSFANVSMAAAGTGAGMPDDDSAASLSAAVAKVIREADNSYDTATAAIPVIDGYHHDAAAVGGGAVPSPRRSYGGHHDDNYDYHRPDYTTYVTLLL